MHMAGCLDIACKLLVYSTIEYQFLLEDHSLLADFFTSSSFSNERRTAYSILRLWEHCDLFVHAPTFECTASHHDFVRQVHRLMVSLASFACVNCSHLSEDSETVYDGFQRVAAQWKAIHRLRVYFCVDSGSTLTLDKCV